jgi:hypothetical protein
VEERQPPESDRRSPASSAGLAAFAFAGTLVVLLGLYLVFRASAPGTASARPSSAPTASAPASSSPAVSADASDVASAGASGGAPSEPPASGSPSLPASPPLEDPVLVGAGDIAGCNLDGDEATARLIDGIDGTVFTAGDNVYDSGSADEFRNCYDPTWGRFKDRTRPAAGNHDWATEDARGYRDYFGDRALNSDGDTWYSYDLGAWHVVVLDANCDRVEGCGPDSDQGRWLAADLAATDPFCTLAIWHQPRFSSGDEHGNDASVDPFWRALYAAGADVVVNGHDHDYERFAPQDPDGNEDRDRGIREFVVGTGGAALRGFVEPQPNSELRVAVSHGVLRLTLRPRQYDWAFITTNATFTDSGSAPCH